MICSLLMISFLLRLNKESKRVEEIINYLFFGILTTFVSILSYFVLRLIIDNYMVCTIISWFISVIFAYFTNRIFVFKNFEKKIFIQLLFFIGSRLISLLFEMITMYILVDFVSVNDKVSKIFVQLIVIVLNYILSKMFVFKNEY